MALGHFGGRQAVGVARRAVRLGLRAAVRPLSPARGRFGLLGVGLRVAPRRWARGGRRGAGGPVKAAWRCAPHRGAASLRKTWWMGW
eukprot:6852934-Lingulodinium_polyedra.AAC.1